MRSASASELILAVLSQAPAGATVDELSRWLNLDQYSLSKSLESLRERRLADYRGTEWVQIWFASRFLKKKPEPLVREIFFERIFLSNDFEKLSCHLTAEEPGTIDLLGTRYVLLADRVITKLITGFFESMGYWQGSEMLYRLGAELGKMHISRWKKRLASLSEFHEACPRKLVFYLASSTLLGWGKNELIEFNPGKGRCTIRIYNHPVSMPEFGKPIHFLEAGMFAELMSHIAGKRVKVSEVKCTSAGANFCEFRSKFKA